MAIAIGHRRGILRPHPQAPFYAVFCFLFLLLLLLQMH